MLTNSQITAGSTAMSLSITGGAAVTFTPTNVKSNGRDLVVSSDADMRSRRKLSVSTNDARPAASAASGYTMIQGTLDFVVPKTLANGKVDYPKIQLKKYFSVENTAAEITEFRRVLAQIALDSDFDDFWNLNSNQ